MYVYIFVIIIQIKVYTFFYCLKGFFVPLNSKCLFPQSQVLPLFEFLSLHICFIRLELYIKEIVYHVV